MTEAIPGTHLESPELDVVIRRRTDWDGEDSIVVEVFANHSGLDRPQIHAWGLSPKHMALARRLERAILDGVVLSEYKVGRDVNGKTYCCPSCCVLGRRMNADLARLGY